MTYSMKRITTEPGSPIKIMIDSPADGDGGFAAGGNYAFWPAGSTEGPDTFAVSEHAARIIMGDPWMAQHFKCTPDLPGAVKDAKKQAAGGKTQAAAGQG